MTELVYDALTASTRLERRSMIISSNQDLFRTAKETAAHLRKRGLTEEAQDLENATTISTLPREFFGEIRLVLKAIPKSQLPIEISTEINAQLAYIEAVL